MTKELLNVETQEIQGQAIDQQVGKANMDKDWGDLTPPLSHPQELWLKCPKAN